jgi:hypothetical protein
MTKRKPAITAGFSFLGFICAAHPPPAAPAPSDPVGYSATDEKIIPGVEPEEILFQILSA